MDSKKITKKYFYALLALFAIAVLLFTYGGCNNEAKDEEQTEEVDTTTPTPMQTPMPSPMTTPTPSPTPITIPSPPQIPPTTLPNQKIEYINEELGFTILVPSTFTAFSSIDPSTKEVGFYKNQDSFIRGIAPIVLIAIDDLPLMMSLKDLIVSGGVADADIEEVTLNNKQYFKWFGSLGEDMITTSYSTRFSDDQVITITSLSQSFTSSNEFIELLSSLNFINK